MLSPRAKAAAVGAAGVFLGWKIADSQLHLSEDWAAIKKLLPIHKQLQKDQATPGWTLADLWERTVVANSAKVCLVDADTDRSFTFAEMDRLANRFAQWASARFKPGECVALVMENRAEYVISWLGLAKAGCPVALINNNIKGKPLVHSITASQAAGVVFGSEIAEAAADVAEALRASGARLLVSYAAGSAAPTDGKPAYADESVDETLPAAPDAPVSKAERRKDGGISKTFGYIYTSGTTGLPKACRISHLKMYQYGMMAGMLGADENDVIYGSGLPIYHSSGNLGLMHMIRAGATLIVRRKFSARAQWEDCAKYKATAMQYIGELCRYLLNTQQQKGENTHSLRLAFGNGLRPEIWDQFQKRFNIVEIGEFYGATEGNSGTFNHCKNYKGQGAVGRAGWLMRRARPLVIVKYDVASEKPARNPQGFCMLADNNEAGELLSPITKIMTADGEKDDFEGYTDAKASESKTLRDVFVKGDRYFRTGDLLRRDGQYMYFVDRIGDTFRWKGENVSTMEVSEVLSTFPGIAEANVYGVQVPRQDGRACAVAITLEKGKDLDPQAFAAHCVKNLPKYSVPLILRFVPEVEVTGTFKHKKGDYRNEGCDPAKIKDDLWWFNPEKKTFEPYGTKEYGLLVDGKAKL